MASNFKSAWDSNDGPIPGENFTSNTKNYPWHRTPEIKDLDDAIDLVIKRVVSDKKKSMGLITLIEMGMPIATATDIIVTQGISSGKWTPDFAILLAGPVARIIEMMAKGAGIKDYVRGWEEDDRVPTKTFFDVQSKKNRSVPDAELLEAKRQAIKAAEEVKESSPSGLGGGGLGMPASKPVEDLAQQGVDAEEMLQ